MTPHWLLSFLLLATLTTRAQGPLAPPSSATPETGPLAASGPGGPQANMKTLHQVEPRTPISSLPYTISEPGSYYLTGHLSVFSGDGIVIQASGVDLDLNGFTLYTASPTTSGTAILITNTVAMVRIANGGIHGLASEIGGGWANGVRLAPPPGLANRHAIRVENLMVLGCWDNGIDLTSTLLGTYGSSVITDCQVVEAGWNAPAEISDPVGYGIRATQVHGCTVDGAQVGISALVVSGCSVAYCLIDGIRASVCAFSTGISSGVDGVGIRGSAVAGSYGGASEAGGKGIIAQVVAGSRGLGGSIGVSGEVTSHSFGAGTSLHGVQAKVASGSWGYALGSGVGILATELVHASAGFSVGGGEGVNSRLTSFSVGQGATGITSSRGAAFSLAVGSGANKGLITTVAVGNYAESVDGSAVDTYVSLANYGIASGSGAGVDASVIGASYGQSATGNGLYASRAAQNSYGRSNGAGIGLRGGVVQNAIGASATGVDLQAIHNQQNSAAE